MRSPAPVHDRSVNNNDHKVQIQGAGGGWAGRYWFCRLPLPQPPLIPTLLPMKNGEKGFRFAPLQPSLEITSLSAIPTP